MRSPTTIWRILLLVLWTALPAMAQAAPPVLFFSDLDSGPNEGGQDDKGAFVTLWGTHFGAERDAGYVTVGGGNVDNYVLWSERKIIVQLGANAASGDILVVTAAGEKSNGIPFRVRPGRIFFIDDSVKSRGSGTFEKPWRSPASFYDRIRPGDIAYFREGVYAENYGGNWGERNFALGQDRGGTEGQPVAFVGYPKETAILRAPGGHGNFTLLDTTRTKASYVTIANLRLEGAGECIGGGGFWQDEEGGGTHIRIIGNRLSANYNGNTMTGLISAQGDGWRILGNELADTGTTPPINNNHAVYVQTGADDVEIGWNTFRDLRMGHVIQVHTDVFYKYEDIRIHDNLITARNPGDARGINVGRALPGTYGSIYNNILYNIGQGFSAIALYAGDWKVYHNTLYNIRAHSGMVWVSGQAGKKPTAEITNNIFYSDGETPYVAALHGADPGQLTLSHNLYFGYRGTNPRPADPKGVYADPLFLDPLRGDFHLQSTSPALGRGSPTGAAVAERDFDGQRRPRNDRIDLGALQTAPSGSSATARR